MGQGKARLEGGWWFVHNYTNILISIILNFKYNNNKNKWQPFDKVLVWLLLCKHKKVLA